MVDPLQRALVRQAPAILIHLPGGNHVRSERFVLVAGWRILVAGAGRIIDATAARHLEGSTLELLEVKQWSAGGGGERGAGRLAAPPEHSGHRGRRFPGKGI